MIVYLDESYASKEKLFLGALFLPTKNSRTWFHRSFIKLKRKFSYTLKSGETKEIKYNYIISKERLEIAKKTVDLFVKCEDAYFRACVVPYNQAELEKVGRQKGVPIKLKEAMLYTRSTYNLIHNTIPEVRGASLMMDEITRARGDRFDDIIRDKLATGPAAIFTHIAYVSSKSERNHLIQVCDLLLGAILNENYPTKSRFKNEFREYVKAKLGLQSLGAVYWNKMLTKKEADTKHPKYNIRYYGVPYKYFSL